MLKKSFSKLNHFPVFFEIFFLNNLLCKQKITTKHLENIKFFFDLIVSKIFLNV